VIKLGEVVMILDLHRQGLTVSAIARELGLDRKTVRKCIARGLEPPVYGPRKPRKRLIDPFVPYLRGRVVAYPGLTGRRLWRKLDRGPRPSLQTEPRRHAHHGAHRLCVLDWKGRERSY
jgi:transposase